MISIKQPLLFTPVYKDYLWGGTRIAEKFKRTGTPAVCAESWEISGHPDGMSVVAQGSLTGCTLDELVQRFGTALTGTLAPQSGRFPLLFKIIDARSRLSVQVHPNNANASLTGGQPKSEMWYVLDCGADASLYAGLRSEATRQSVETALTQGSLAGQLTELRIKPDQALFIPGGLVHAIGDDSLIYEVQQSSNTTYRLFDWNRTAADGSPRQLHVTESLTSIDWQLKPPAMITPALCGREAGASWFQVVSCEYFTLKKLELSGSVTLAQDGTTFTALFVNRGAASIRCGGIAYNLAQGASALIPAAAGCWTITAADPAAILVTTL